MLFTTPNLLSLENRLLMSIGKEPRYAYHYYHYHMFTLNEINKVVGRSKFKRTEKIVGNFLIVSTNRNKIIGIPSEAAGKIWPSLAKHFIVRIKK